jgi:hypothetical protein
VNDNDNDRIAYLAGEPGESLSPAERAQLDELRAMLGSSEAWEEPDPGLEDRVVAAIASESAAESPAKSPRRRRRWRFAIGWPAYGFAAAAAVVAIVVVLSASGGSNSTLRFAMVVSGTPLAPGAHGSASLVKTGSGWRIELRATGLPHLAGHSYYQAWLKNPAGILVPVGTFNDARNVTLWSGVPVTVYRTFSVTIQQANGNPASSGRRVLTGTAYPVH